MFDVVVTEWQKDKKNITNTLLNATEVSYANGLDSDETPSNSAFHPDPS